MHKYAKVGQNIPSGSRVMSMYTNLYQMDSHSDYSAHLQVVQYCLDYDHMLFLDQNTHAYKHCPATDMQNRGEALPSIRLADRD